MQLSQQQLDVESWVRNPNPNKRNLIIPARAGSGKTFLVTHCAQFMKGDVIMLAFGAKAAWQLKEKLSRMGVPNAISGTFHATGKGMLYKAKGWHNVPKNGKVYWITEKYCQRQDLQYTRNFITKLVGFAKQNAFGVKGQTSIDDTQAWMEIITHHDIDTDFDADLGEVIEIAKQVLRDSNLDFRSIDFDDMQYLPLIYDIKGQQYDWVVVDEAQDTNVCRKLLAAKLVKPDGRCIFIGDEGQAIMGFTGAENDSMNLIRERFECEELPLSICYRCGKNIIKTAQEFFPDIMAYEGNCEGSVTSMKYQEFVDQAMNIKLDRNVGILCRNNAPNVALAFALIRQGIGCRIEGKDIGKDLIKLVNKWKKVKTLSDFIIKLNEFFNKEFEKASYAKMQQLEDKLDTMIILIERVQSLGKDDLYSLEKLIADMFTDSKDGNLPNIVTFSSIHKAKGLEWKTVYWLGDAQFSPSKYAVLPWMQQQEKHLRYVAATRAMESLIHLTDAPSRRNREE
jgi:superfamily I DNA/RNA helicase